MKIDNNCSSPSFGAAYFNMQSIQKYGKSLHCQNGRSKIISALKERNTPLREFIREVINSRKFEDEIGDVFISFDRQKKFGEGEDLFDTINFIFPKKQQQAKKNAYKLITNDDECRWHKFFPYREEIAEKFADDTNYFAGFRDYDYSNEPFLTAKNSAGKQNGVEHLVKYLKSSQIVDDLKIHIERIRNKYI